MNAPTSGAITVYARRCTRQRSRLRRESAVLPGSSGIGRPFQRDFTPIPHNGCRPAQRRRVVATALNKTTLGRYEGF